MRRKNILYNTIHIINLDLYLNTILSFSLASIHLTTESQNETKTTVDFFIILRLHLYNSTF